MNSAATPKRSQMIDNFSQKPRLRWSWRIAFFLLIAAALTDSTARADNLVDGARTGPSLDLPEANGAFRHLQALQDIATANGGNRATGTPGYDRSADYVAKKLKEAGYVVRFEEFDFPVFDERQPPVLVTIHADGRHETAAKADIRTLSYPGSSDVTARVRGVGLRLSTSPPQSSNSGCEPDHFKNFERGAIALMRRGSCTFQVKVDNAIAAGAAGAVIMNEGIDGRVDRPSGRLRKAVAIPVIGVSYELGRSLDLAARTGGGAQVRLAVDAVMGRRVSHNVLAHTPSDSDGQLIVVGAHLDSVAEGPGINDNGSGTAAVLEAALQFARNVPEAVRKRVRFGFWGAEELSLEGSSHHVASLSEQQRRNIVLYINFDMVASPNYGRFIRGPEGAGDAPGAAAQREFAAYFREHNLPVDNRGGGGRVGSDDDASFFRKGIPTLSFDTGAGNTKREAQAKLFGGTAGRPYDPCYHQACDTIENINREALEQNTRALLHTITVTATRMGRGVRGERSDSEQ
jgi:Zn-dependent M28 family amino/carboxypeptidase